MQKWIGLALVMLVSGSVFAATKGTTTLKNSDADSDVRVTRKAIESLDRDIKSLDQRISETRMQAIAQKSVQAPTPTAGAALEALATSLEIERNQMMVKRDSLRTDLQYQAN